MKLFQFIIRCHVLPHRLCSSDAARASSPAASDAVLAQTAQEGASIPFGYDLLGTSLMAEPRPFDGQGDKLVPYSAILKLSCAHR